MLADARVEDALNEKRIIAWLLDQNPIQRVIVKTAAGKHEVVAELDLSGGLNALLNLLRSDAPIPGEFGMRSRARSIRWGPQSFISRSEQDAHPGAPPLSIPSGAQCAELTTWWFTRKRPRRRKQKVKKRRPIRAAGTHSKKVTVDEKTLELGVSRSEHYRRLSANKSLKLRGKKLP